MDPEAHRHRGPEAAARHKDLAQAVRNRGRRAATAHREEAHRGAEALPRKDPGVRHRRDPEARRQAAPPSHRMAFARRLGGAPSSGGTAPCSDGAARRQASCRHWRSRPRPEARPDRRSGLRLADLSGSRHEAARPARRQPASQAEAQTCRSRPWPSRPELRLSRTSRVGCALPARRASSLQAAARKEGGAPEAWSRPA